MMASHNKCFHTYYGHFATTGLQGEEVAHLVEEAAKVGPSYGVGRLWSQRAAGPDIRSRSSGLPDSSTVPQTKLYSICLINVKFFCKQGLVFLFPLSDKPMVGIACNMVFKHSFMKG